MLNSIKHLPFLAKHFYNISRFEKWSPDKIERYQVKAFQKIFTNAKKIPFYKELYERAGVLDAKINSLGDMKQLPTIDKAYCRENGYEDYFIKKDIPGSMITATSGSTGIPFQIRIPKRIEMVPPIKVIHAMRQFGWHPFMKGLEIWREDSSTHKNFMRKMGLLKSVSIFKPLEEIKEKIQKEKPDFLFCTRSFYLEITNYFEQIGLKINPKYLLCTTEDVSAEQRKRLEKYYGTRLINVYGCMESPTIAYSCPTYNNLHVFQTTVIIEVINQKTIEGKEFGEIALTNLTNNLMPFIRYRTGDVVEITHKRCQCRRNSQILGNIIGRSDNIIKTTDGKIFNFHHFYHIFRGESLINQYKVIYHKRENILEFIFTLKLKEDIKEKLEYLDNLVKKSFSNIKYKITIVGRMPISESGKFKLIEINEG